MKRRALLGTVATGAALLAGCVASGGIGDDDDSPTDGDSSTDGGVPSVQASTIETVGRECAGGETRGATAERGDESVTIEGTIGASTPCHEAVLADVEIHNRQLVLRVDIESTEGVCQQCLGAVDYRASVEIENVEGLDGTTVEHVGGEEHTTNWDEPDGTSP